MRRLITFLLFFIVQFQFVNSQTIVNITNANQTVSSYSDKQVIISGKSELHLTATSNVLNNTTIELKSEDSWVFFDNIRPNDVISTYLPKVIVNGLVASLNSNVRVSVYKHGTVVIPHSSAIQPLKVYTAQNFGGDSASYSLYNYNKSLAANIDNHIRSFKLKRGYMATLATSSDGMGYSRVFIADNEDLNINILPDLLDEKVSFIRVFSWEWVTKKGWCGSNPSEYGKLNATWRYDWSAGGNSTNAIEYVPIKQNLGWPGWTEINDKSKVTHLLGYNEPDHVEQSNVTVAQAIKEWPNMLKSGLRVGTPACTNFSWLYQFMDSCKAHNYRVDYVAIHSYWGGKSPQSWYNDLKYISQRTGRPLWITEWNNGANWTSEWWPTSDHSLSAANAAKQLADIKAILNVLDTASFVERYSIYNWVQDCRAMVLADTLTPAGKYYADNKSVMAFNRKYEVIPTFTLGDPSLSIAIGSRNLSITESDPNFENFNGLIIEKSIDDSDYVEVFNSDDRFLKSFIDTLDISMGSKVRYRAKVKLPNGLLSNYTNEVGYDITKGGSVQYGNVGFSNVDWNPVFFNKPFSTIPTIILGAPTNNNNSVLMAPRVKLISYSSRFNVQLSPWSYQNVTGLTKTDNVPYFVIAPGNYNFGGLQAKAARATVASTWTTVNFAAPFETVPVVFANELSPAFAEATTVAIRNVTKTGFEAKLQKEEAVTKTLNSGTVTYFAITQGTGSIDGSKLIVGKTADDAISLTGATKIEYGESIENPVFLSQMQSCNDDVAASLRCLTVTPDYSYLLKQREKSMGVSTGTKESAGWMVISPATVIQSVNNPVDKQFDYYPNPVKDFIQIIHHDANEMTVEIQDISGITVKRILLTNNRIDVSDLPPGYYILKALHYKAKKFIKI